MAKPEKPWYLSMIVAFIRYDVPSVVGINPATLERDIVTLLSRVDSEGESFLTKTLPSFGKAIDFALQERAPLHVSGFKRSAKSCVIPAFLQGLTKRVFLADGHLRNDPCIRSIIALRQICYWCKKVQKGYSDESLRKAMDDLIQVDRDLPGMDDIRPNRFLVAARGIIQSVLKDINLHSVTPKHGPGSVAWCAGNPVVEKWKLSRSYKTLERCFRPIPWFFSLRDASEDPHRITGRFQTDYGLSRLAFVEKDSSGPRVIGLEPAEYMWCQQAIKTLLYHHLESHPLTRGRVNFTSQSVNRDLTGKWQTYDTLDMSKASDRNSFALVKFLMQGSPVWPYLEHSRTPGVVLPDGNVLFYKKFAPMGSATCFPVEALTFYALAVSVLWEGGYPLSLALKNVFVYGDDLVVPHGFFELLDEKFSSVGLKFSTDKCCISGKFRESCGMDAYDGHDVTPVRLRRPHGNAPTDHVSLVEHHNALMTKGYTAAAGELRSMVSRRKAIIAMRIPDHTDLTLPIYVWLNYERSTVKFYYKNSMSYVIGPVFRTNKIRGCAADEKSYLRGSLASGGAVGAFSGRPWSVRPRVFALPREGVVVWRRLPLGR